LKELCVFKNLRSLDLSGTNVTDDGLAILRELKNLKFLCLHDTHTTEAGVTRVLPNLAR
jgi:Leucine-rich repeat (LRR) protein